MMKYSPLHSTSPVSTLTPPNIEAVLDSPEVSENENEHGAALARSEPLESKACSFGCSNDVKAA